MADHQIFCHVKSRDDEQLGESEYCSHRLLTGVLQSTVVPGRELEGTGQDRIPICTHRHALNGRATSKEVGRTTRQLEASSIFTDIMKIVSPVTKQRSEPSRRQPGRRTDDPADRWTERRLIWADSLHKFCPEPMARLSKAEKCIQWSVRILFLPRCKFPVQRDLLAELELSACRAPTLDGSLLDIGQEVSPTSQPRLGSSSVVASMRASQLARQPDRSET